VFFSSPTRQYGFSFIRLAVVGSQICEIPPNSERIRPSSSRSSKVVDRGINRKLICDFLLVINSNVGRIPAVFEILTFKARTWHVFPTTPLFDAPIRGSQLEFLDKTYPAKTKCMGLPYGENFIILTSTVLVSTV